MPGTEDVAEPNERRCIATGVSGPRDPMIRFVVGPDGTVVADYFAVMQLYLNHFTAADAEEAARQALAADGVFALWAEAADATFEKRLGRAGFAFERRRPPGGGLRHAVYLARPKSARRPGSA